MLSWSSIPEMGRKYCACYLFDSLLWDSGLDLALSKGLRGFFDLQICKPVVDFCTKELF